MQQQDFLSSLRAATAAEHKYVEQLELPKRIMSPELKVNEYEQYLRKLYAIHSFTEESVFPVISGIMTDSLQRKKTGALEKDLSALGSNVQKTNSFSSEGYKSTIPFNMGMAYVSEGSTLGGLYILKNVNAVLGEQVTNATHFLNVYGAQTGALWKLFLAQLENYQAALNDNERAEVIAGAVYGFKRTAFVFNEPIKQPL